MGTEELQARVAKLDKQVETLNWYLRFITNHMQQQNRMFSAIDATNLAVMAMLHEMDHTPSLKQGIERMFEKMHATLLATLDDFALDGFNYRAQIFRDIVNDEIDPAVH